MFWERFYQLCISAGTKPNPVGKEIGVSSGVITKWKNGSIPTADALVKIADYFDCSIDYLMGRTDSPELIKKAPPIGGAGEEYEIDKDAPPLSAEEIARLRQFLRDSNPGTGK